MIIVRIGASLELQQWSTEIEREKLYVYLKLCILKCNNRVRDLSIYTTAERKGRKTNGLTN